MPYKIQFVLLLFSLVGFMEANAQQLPQIYVHTDRSIYSPGDTVWFKAYLMHDGKLDPRVRNLYIDWADSSDRVLECNVYIASEGYSFSQYVVPADLPSPTLYLNAYTGNIQDKGFLGFTKSLHIIQSRQDRIPGGNSYHLSIVPNGGRLVRDMSNTVALRSEDSRSLPFAYEVELLDRNYDVLLQARSDSSGLAQLEFTPDDDIYRVRWTGSDGRPKVEQLPQTLGSGILLRLSEQGDGLLALVRPSPGIAGDYTLRARLNQLELFEQPISLTGKPINVALPADMLRFGLLQLSLRDSEGGEQAHLSEVIGSRDVLVEPELVLVEQTRGAKGRQRIALQFPGVESANLSVSIVDAFSLPDSTDRILNAVLANQSIGPVALPADSALAAWSGTVPWNRDYTVVDTLSPLADAPLYVSGDISMTDKAWKAFEKSQESARRRSLAPAGSVSVGYRPVRQDTVNYPFHYTTAMIDADRRIALKDLQFFDTMEFRLSHIDRKNQFEDMEVAYRFKPFADHGRLMLPESHLEPKGTYGERAVAHMEQVDANFATHLKNHNLIETVVVTRKVKPLAVQEMEDKFGVSDWFRNSREDFLPQQDPYVIRYSVNLKDYLERTFAGVFIVGIPEIKQSPISTPSMDVIYQAEGKILPNSGSTGGKTYLTLRRTRFSKVYINERLCYDREMPDRVSPIDKEFLAEVMFSGGGGYDMSWVGLVKILNGAHGDELAMYVFAPDDVNRDLSRKIDFNHVGGYSPIFEVNNKTYTPESDRSEKDERLTLYWHPLLLKQQSDKVLDLEFYNNDFGRGYWIVIKGVTGDGRLVDVVRKIEVEHKQ